MGMLTWPFYVSYILSALLAVHCINKTPYNDKPETIKWLNKMPERISLWNDGASIWRCTLSVAKIKNAKVLAFELSSKSLLALMNNIKLNSFEDQVIPCCFA